MFSSLQTTVQTPAKCPGPRSAPSRTSDEPGDADRRGEALGVDLADRRGEQHVDAELGRLDGVVGLAARVGGEVAGVVELRRVDEQRDDDRVLLVARGAHQRVVAGVEGAHRRHQPDRAPLGARVAEPGPHLGDCPDRPHVSSSVYPPRRGSPRPARSRRAAARACARRSPARWRSTVPSSPRAIGPVSAASGPSSAHWCAVASTSGASCARRDARRSPRAAPRRPRARRGSSRRSRPPRGRRRGPRARRGSRSSRAARASASAVVERALGRAVDRGARAAQHARRRAGRRRTSAGAGEKPSRPPKHVEPGRAGAVAEQRAVGHRRARPRRSCRRARTAGARPRRPGSARRAGAAGASSAAASTVPSRPAPTTAQAGASWGLLRVQFSHRDTGSAPF